MTMFSALFLTKVKAAIFNEPSLKVSQINVEAYKGVVQLSAASSKAVALVREVKGVSSLKNDTRLR